MLTIVRIQIRIIIWLETTSSIQKYVTKPKVHKYDNKYLNTTDHTHYLESKVSIS